MPVKNPNLTIEQYRANHKAHSTKYNLKNKDEINRKNREKYAMAKASSSIKIDAATSNLAVKHEPPAVKHEPPIVPLIIHASEHNNPNAGLPTGSIVTHNVSELNIITRETLAIEPKYTMEEIILFITSSELISASTKQNYITHTRIIQREIGLDDGLLSIVRLGIYEKINSFQTRRTKGNDNPSAPLSNNSKKAVVQTIIWLLTHLHLDTIADPSGKKELHNYFDELKIKSCDDVFNHDAIRVNNLSLNKLSPTIKTNKPSAPVISTELKDVEDGDDNSGDETDNEEKSDGVIILTNPVINPFTVPVSIFNKWIELEHITPIEGVQQINKDDVSFMRLLSLMKNKLEPYLLCKPKHSVKRLYDDIDYFRSVCHDVDQHTAKLNKFIQSWGLTELSPQWKAFSFCQLHEIPPYVGGMYLFVNIYKNETIDDVFDIIYVGVHPKCILSRQLNHHLHYTPDMWARDFSGRAIDQTHSPNSSCVLIPMEWDHSLPLAKTEKLYINAMLPLLNLTELPVHIKNIFNELNDELNDTYYLAEKDGVKDVDETEKQIDHIIEQHREWINSHINDAKTNIHSYITALSEDVSFDIVMPPMPFDHTFSKLKNKQARAKYIKKCLTLSVHNEQNEQKPDLDNTIIVV